MLRPVVVLSLCLCALWGCGSEDERVCPEGPLFSVSPVHPDSIQNVDPLGNLNPSGHVFPSDHGGVYLITGAGGEPVRIQFYCPGDLTIVHARASHHVNAGITDFAFYFEYCNDVSGYLGHVTSLDPDLFGDDADFTRWPLTEEYSTGGETYRLRTLDMNLDVPAGTRLGTVGGNPGQGGFDFGLIDRTSPAVTAARPSRWDDYPYARFFLEYYEDGPVSDELWSLVNREPLPGDPWPGGRALQDVPGTAHGCWFHPGDPHPPEDTHLALVQSHIRPSRLAFSVGTSVPTLPVGVYLFAPSGDGTVNRAFAIVRPETGLCVYHSEWPEVTILLEMPDENTVRIEGLGEIVDDPARWVFSAQATEFVR